MATQEQINQIAIKLQTYTDREFEQAATVLASLGELKQDKVQLLEEIASLKVQIDELTESLNQPPVDFSALDAAIEKIAAIIPDPVTPSPDGDPTVAE